MRSRSSLFPMVGSVIATACLTAGAHAQTTLYVDPASPPGGTGASWAAAYNDLHDALAFATANPDPAGYVLRLAAGLYVPYDSSDYFIAPDNISILGGHSTVADERDPDAFPSILSADVMGNDEPDDPATLTDNSFRLLYISAGALREPVMLDGLTLAHVVSSDAAFRCTAGELTLHDCTFGPNYGANGAAADVTSANVSDCRFVDNRVGFGCGEIPASISDCLFERNATGLSIGLFANSNVTRCTLQNNALAIGVTAFDEGQITIADCLIQQNIGEPGGRGSGINFTAYLNSGATLLLQDCRLLHNTIGDPEDPSGYGGAIYASKGEVHATGCLLAENVARFGGAYYGVNTRWTFNTCTIRDNHAGSFMAAGWSGDLSATDTLFTDNHDPGPYTLYARQADLTRTDLTSSSGGLQCSGLTADTCRFESNSGRAVETGAIQATDCVFAHNTLANGDGAAIICSGGSLIRCQFTDNHALAGNAGALAARASASTSIEDSTFDANSCSFDGGALASSGLPSVSGCSFTDNTAGSQGGAVRSGGTFSDCIFERNLARTGGAIDARASGVIRDSTFRLNHAEQTGGAIRWPAAVIRCAIEENTAGTDGAAIHTTGSVSILSSTIFGNVALANGGGLWTSGATTIANTILAGNDALFGAGIYKADDSALTMRNTLVYANAIDSMDNGAGLYAASASGLSISNSILWANGIPVPPYKDRAQLFAYTAISPDHTIIQDTMPVANRHVSADDPLFLDPLGPDGIPGTPDDDLRPSATSPAIDAGDAATLPADAFDLDDDTDTVEPLPLDLADAPRVSDSPYADGSGVDIGPYEFTADCAGPPDCNANDIRDDCEIAMGIARDCNANAIPDECDIDSGLSQDCNEDAIPDECQILYQYALDDLLETGLTNLAYITYADVGDRAEIMLAQYRVLPGQETINAVQFYAAGVEEHAALILIYDDPNNDGQPDDARLIAASSPVQSPSDDTPIRTAYFPMTTVGQPGDSFFVGYYGLIGPTIRPDGRVQYTVAGYVRSACMPEREFVSLSLGSLDDAVDLADDSFISATFFNQDCSAEVGESFGPTTLLLRPTRLAYYDCNADTTPDECETPTPDDTNADGVPDDCQCLTDLDGDGLTTVFDFTRIVAGFNTTAGATLIDGDIDADHDVDINDFQLFVLGFGMRCREQPEPARSAGAARDAIMIADPP